ncbi:MAG: hypothetical protein ACKVS8_05480 [Phycisphaerales bacterium]
MSKDKAEKPAAAAPAAEAVPAKKKSPIVMIGVVGVIMIVEAVAVFFVFSAMGPKKASAEVAPAEMKHDEGEEIVELKVVDDKFQNLQQGKVWFWDTSVFVQVKQKNAEHVEGLLAKREAEVHEGLAQIMGRSQPAQLKEPDRQTLNRQFAGFLEKVLGKDAEGHGYVERVLIPRCRGIPGEF